MEIRFDAVITGYVMLLPALIILVFYSINKNPSFVKGFLFYWIFILFSITFYISTIDIPYFQQFFIRLNVDALKWMDSPVFVIKMVLQEPKFAFMFLPFIFLIWGFYKLLKKIFSTYMFESINSKLPIRVIFSFLVLGMIFMGIRGRLESKSPIRIGTAYISNDPFFNQLGLNPNFTFLKSYIEESENSKKNSI